MRRAMQCAWNKVTVKNLFKALTNVRALKFRTCTQNVGPRFLKGGTYDPVKGGSNRLFFAYCTKWRVVTCTILTPSSVCSDPLSSDEPQWKWRLANLYGLGKPPPDTCTVFCVVMSTSIECPLFCTEALLGIWLYPDNLNGAHCPAIVTFILFQINLGFWYIDGRLTWTCLAHASPSGRSLS